MHLMNVVPRLDNILYLSHLYSKLKILWVTAYRVTKLIKFSFVAEARIYADKSDVARCV